MGTFEGFWGFTGQFRIGGVRVGGSVVLKGSGFSLEIGLLGVQGLGCRVCCEFHGESRNRYPHPCARPRETECTWLKKHHRIKKIAATVQ